MTEPWIVGHRGSPTEEVENTIPSFERAVAQDGANALEMDISVTREGELLVWHDFDPTGIDARLRQWNFEPQVRFRPRSFDGPVSELTVAEARERLGFVGVTDLHIPTLGEVFDWARGRPSLGLVFLDVKLPARRVDLLPTLLRRLDQLLATAMPRFTLVLECGELELADEIRRLGAKHPIALDVRSKTEIDAVSRLECTWACAQKPRPLQSLFPFKRQCQLLADCDGGDCSRCAFTINDEEEMRALIDLGVSAIQTDRPALLRSVLAQPRRRVAA
jgi:glycerophosphoryl diester phosphodiesterase